MSFPEPPHGSDAKPSLVTVLVDGFATCGCAVYPTAAAIEMPMELQAPRPRRDRAWPAFRKPSEATRRHRRPCEPRRVPMHDRVEALLRRRSTGIAARALLTLPFWASGIAKLIAFDSGVAEMAHHGLEPAVAFNIATIATQLIGSGLIIANRIAWLGAGALGIFTGFTILLVHRFWEMAGASRTIAFHAEVEHIGIIGGLVGIAILSARCTGRAAGTSHRSGRS